MNKQIFTLVRKMLSMLFLTERDENMFLKNNYFRMGTQSKVHYVVS